MLHNVMRRNKCETLQTVLAYALKKVFHAVAAMIASMRSDDDGFKICIFGPRLHLRQNFRICECFRIYQI